MTRLFNRPLAAVALALLGVAGCADDASQNSMQQRQDAALKDPFSYGPTTPPPPGRPVPEPAIKPRDDSLKGEWKDFWNP